MSEQLKQLEQAAAAGDTTACVRLEAIARRIAAAERKLLLRAIPSS